jgi:hypothetical protein
MFSLPKHVFIINCISFKPVALMDGDNIMGTSEELTRGEKANRFNVCS